MFLSPELGVLVTALGAESVVAAVVGEVGFTTVAAAVEGAAHGGGAAVEEGPRSLAMAARDLVSMSMRLDLPVFGKALSEVDTHARSTACFLVRRRLFFWGDDFVVDVLEDGVGLFSSEIWWRSVLKWSARRRRWAT